MIDLLDISEQSEGCGTEKEVPFGGLFQPLVGRVRPASGRVYHPPNNTRRQTPSVYAIPPLWGIDTYACPEGGEIREVYHSCKEPFLPHMRLT